jgi:hypothetical protein
MGAAMQQSAKAPVTIHALTIVATSVLSSVKS